MKLIHHLLAAISFIIIALPVFSQKSEETDKARQQAEIWLPLVDDGDYQESWETAAPMFQQSVTQEQWTQAARQVREPLGELKSRKLRNAEHSTSLPNAPEGEYVKIEFSTSFANANETTETIVMKKTEDEAWATVGYFIKPTDQ